MPTFQQRKIHYSTPISEQEHSHSLELKKQWENGLSIKGTYFLIVPKEHIYQQRNSKIAISIHIPRIVVKRKHFYAHPYQRSSITNHR